MQRLATEHSWVPPLHSGDSKLSVASALRGGEGLVGRSEQLHHWRASFT